METHCPACKKPVSKKGLALHIRFCEVWKKEIGIPSKEYNFDEYFKRGLYAEGLTEDVDYVQCRICGVRKKRLGDHLKKAHGMTSKEYTAKYNALAATPRTNQLREQTVKERFGVSNVFQSEAIKEKSKQTSLDKYGVEHAAMAPEVVERRKATNQSRYGAENVFGAEEIKDKIKQTHLERYGVENPNQSPEIMAQRMATNLERYGEEHFLLTQEFQEKFKAISQERYGADHPMQSELGMSKFEASIMSTYGVRNPFLDPEVHAKSQETNRRNHGGKHHTQTPEFLEKRAKTCMEKYGVDNPSKADEVKARIKEVWMENYGVPFPPNSLWTNQTMSFPNNLEKRVDALSPDCLVYSGDGSYYVSFKGAPKVRNPDFVMLNPKQLQAYQNGVDLNLLRTYMVVEVFGDYWHGPERTGKSREAHKAEVLEYYEKCGIRCLVLWESEVKADPKNTAQRLFEFIYG